MTKLLTFEQQLTDLTESLLHHPRFEIETHTQGSIDEERNDGAAVLDSIDEWYQVRLDPAYQKCISRFSQLGMHWSIDEPDVQLTGEFNIKYLLDVIGDVPPHLAGDDTPDTRRQLFSEFRVIDDTPSSGTGTLSSIRLQGTSATPELWFFDVRRDVFRMEVDYCEYMRHLLLTKGAYGWQYLFTDAPLRDRDFKGIVDGLKLMLQIFPEVFPNEDFAPLRTRLSERLR